VRIQNIRHRGPRRLIEHDDHRGVRRDLVNRVRNILAALVPPMTWLVWQARQTSAFIGLSEIGQDRGASSVSGNWRITFDIEDGEVCDLDLEDYH
jgi:proteic killer suppression protein